MDHQKRDFYDQQKEAFFIRKSPGKINLNIHMAILYVSNFILAPGI